MRRRFNKGPFKREIELETDKKYGIERGYWFGMDENGIKFTSMYSFHNSEDFRVKIQKTNEALRILFEGKLHEDNSLLLEKN